MVECGEVESLVFTLSAKVSDGVSNAEAAETAGSSNGEEEEEEEEEDDDDDDEAGGVLLHHPPAPEFTNPALIRESVNPGARQAGMQRARNREMVRQAGRRMVAFGIEGGGAHVRRVEAVQKGKVVESSFAKGEWGVRLKS